MNSYLYNKKHKKELEKDLNNEDFSRITISFYKYVKFSQLESLRDTLYKDFIDLNVLGRVYIAREGINAQISIPENNYDKIIDYIYSYDELNDVQIKKAIEDGTSFYKLVIKVKNEIVAYGMDKDSYNMDKVGTHLDPADFNKQLSIPGSIVVDIRNHYESEVGRFKGAIVPDVDRSQELLEEVKSMLDGKENNKILLYCTGGIRCEKASAYLIKNNFKDVNQLKGGVVNYANQVKKKNLESKFIGKNFVFDARMGERITQDIISGCHQCKQKADSHINCANDLCHLLFIQCNTCSQKFLGCCSIECLNFYNLDDRMKAINKQEFLDYNSKRLNGQVKPKLYDILKLD